MPFEHGFSINHEDTRVTVLSASPGPFWLLFVIFAAPVACVMITATQTGLAFWIGQVLGLASLGLGGFLILPSSVTTTFDLGTRQAVHQRSFGGGRIRLRYDYFFADIAGIGFKAYHGDGDGDPSYVPVIVLRDGKTRWLGVWNGGAWSRRESTNTTFIRTICSATSLKEIHV